MTVLVVIREVLWEVTEKEKIKSLPFFRLESRIPWFYIPYLISDLGLICTSQKSGLKTRWVRAGGSERSAQRQPWQEQQRAGLMPQEFPPISSILCRRAVCTHVGVLESEVWTCPDPQLPSTLPPLGMWCLERPGGTAHWGQCAAGSKICGRKAGPPCSDTLMTGKQGCGEDLMGVWDGEFNSVCFSKMSWNSAIRGQEGQVLDTELNKMTPILPAGSLQLTQVKLVY